MEHSNSSFQLWSPPLLDLSLDSFSTDLIQEFDKTRQTLDDNEIDRTQQVIAEADKHQQSQQSILSSSSVTLPSSSDNETSSNEEDGPSSASNIFRNSSTSIKDTLNLNNETTRKTDEGIMVPADSAVMTNSAEEISNIASRQYPPKPLQYSVVVEPPSDNLTMPVNRDEQEQDYDNAVIPDLPVTTLSSTAEATIESAAIMSTETTIPTTIAANNAQSAAVNPPKKRSFFSFRFC